MPPSSSLVPRNELPRDHNNSNVPAASNSLRNNPGRVANRLPSSASAVESTAPRSVDWSPETPGRAFIHQVLTSGNNLEEIIFQLDDAIRGAVLSENDQRLLLTAIFYMRRQELFFIQERPSQPTIIHTPFQAMDSIAWIVNSAESSRDGSLLMTAGRRIRESFGMPSEHLVSLLRDCRNGSMRPELCYSVFLQVFRVMIECLERFSLEEVERLRVSNPNLYSEVEQLVAEISRLRGSIGDLRGILGFSEAERPNHRPGQVHQNQDAGQQVDQPRAHSAPVATPAVPFENRTNITSLRNQNGSTLPQALRIPHQDPRPRPELAPKALIGRRINFRTMSNEALLQTRWARELVGLEIHDMDCEITFRVMHDPDEWGPIGKAILQSRWSAPLVKWDEYPDDDVEEATIWSTHSFSSPEYLMVE